MSLYSEEMKQEHIERVREMMVFKSNATVPEIIEMLQAAEPPLVLSNAYVQRIRQEVVNQRIERIKTVDIKQRIAEVQDKKRLVDQRLWLEAMDKNSPASARIAALRFLMQNEHELLQAEMDAGIYERQLGTVESVKILTPEQRSQVIAVMRRWGIVKGDLPYEEKEQRNPELVAGSN